MRFELEQHLTGIDRVAGRNRDAYDPARDRGPDLVFHLHRFDDDQRRTCGKLITLGDHDADDATRHRRDDRATVAAAVARAADEVGERGLLRGHHTDGVDDPVHDSELGCRPRCDGDQHVGGGSWASDGDAVGRAVHDLVGLTIHFDAAIAIDLDLMISFADAHAKSLNRGHAGEATP